VGSPITFSGFNNIDFNTILNAVMSQESQPLTALQTRQSTLKAQNSAFGTLIGKLSTLGTAADALKDSTSMAKLTASSSDATGVGVSSTSGTIPGTYQVNVTSLAQAQVSASQTYTSTSAIVGTAGQTLTINPSTGDPMTVTLTGDTTLQELANLVNNGQTQPPATASIVQISPGHYQLVLTAASTGTANSFTIASGLTGGEGLSFTDTDNDGVSGDDLADLTRQAKDAVLSVNGLSITSSTNSLTDVVPGVTLSLNKDATNAVVTVSRDTASAKDLVKKFIDAYNAIAQFTKDQTNASLNGQVSIGRDPVLRSFKDNMRGTLMAEYGSGTYKKLAEVGIGFDRDGKMTLDSTAFDRAMSTSPSELQTLFSGSSGNGGAFGALAGLVKEYSQAGGFVSSVRTRIDEEVTRIDKRIASMQATLEIRRQALQQEYIAADLAMTQLKNQSGSLASLASGLSF